MVHDTIAQYPHSLGLFYSAMTSFLGFRPNDGEYKVMGLAPYGEPIYCDLIKNNLIEIKSDGSYKLNMSFFGFCTSTVMTNKKFHELFGGLPRTPEDELTQRDMDIAASIQNVLEEVVLKIAISIKEETGQKNLCIAGGVALNCVANGKIVEKGIFERVWIQPASGDAGGALGAALAVHYLMLENPRHVNSNDDMNGGYLGPSFSQSEIEDSLLAAGANFKVLEHEKLIEDLVCELISGKAVGWHQGRMEFGPRALGARSIIADPRSPLVQRQLNLKIKYRESFRPFAPSVMEEYLNEWFCIKQKSPYMLLVGNVLKDKLLPSDDSNSRLVGLDKLKSQRSLIPAVTHVDNTSRIQTVSRNTNSKFWDLLSKFNEITNCPVLVNTSFNIRGEPIVCTPEDSFRCFMGTDIEVLVVGNCFLRKEDQDPSLKVSYLDLHELD
jgi:carbamoyltransferase